MAGRRQHHIPQIVLRQFGKKSKGKGIQAYVAKPNQEPFKTNIINIALERDFYSNKDDGEIKSLDEKITDYEDTLSDHHRNLIEVSEFNNIEENVAAKFIAHMIVRSAIFRHSFGEVAGKLVKGVTEIASDSNQVAELSGLKGLLPNASLQETIKKEWTSNFAIQTKFNFNYFEFEKYAFTFMKGNFKKIHHEGLPEVMKLHARFETEKAEILKGAHNKALDESHTPDAWVQKLKKFKWHIEISESESFILPDSLSICADKSGTYLPYLYSEEDKVATIFTPISPKRLLVGTSETSDSLQHSAIVEELAKCSWKYFITRDLAKNQKKLQGLIGKSSSLNFSKMAEEALSDFNKQE